MLQIYFLEFYREKCIISLYVHLPTFSLLASALGVRLRNPPEVTDTCIVSVFTMVP